MLFVYLKRVPNIIKPLAKNLVFDIPNDSEEIYVTFDDGPHPQITPWVLDQLALFDAKATFFLVANNLEGNEALVERIVDEGHQIGIHGTNHLSGWKTSEGDYIEDVMDAARRIDSKLFRPPYGEITRSQASRLSKDLKLIMWSHLSADFDPSISSEQCVQYATSKIKSGSIIVFHDSEKAKPRLLGALPSCLEFYRNTGFNMKPISL